MGWTPIRNGLVLAANSRVWNGAAYGGRDRKRQGRRGAGNTGRERDAPRSPCYAASTATTPGTVLSAPATCGETR